MTGGRRVWLFAGPVAVGLSLWATLSASGLTGDYGNVRCRTLRCEDPSVSLHALVTGDISGFFAHQPGFGITSLALRAPGVAIAHAWGGNTQDEFRAGALVCFLVAALVGTWLAARAVDRGVSLAAGLALVALWTIALVGGRAIYYGHPEEPLGAALTVVALVFAHERRPAKAAIVLALAIATKEWAVLAAPALVLAGGPGDWRRMLVPGGAAVLLLIGVMAVGNLHQFRAAHAAVARNQTLGQTPANVWFRFGHRTVTGAQGRVYTYVVKPPRISHLARAAVIAIALATGLLFLLRRGFGTRDTLALVGFAFVCRVVLDPATLSYHLIPLLMTVAAFEVLGRKRIPVVGILAMTAFELTVHYVAAHMSANAFNAIFLAWTLALGAYLLAIVMRRPGQVTSAAQAAGR